MNGSSAARQRAYLQRKKQGLTRSALPWGWLTSAQAAEAARQAFRTATWAAHQYHIPASEFAALLGSHMVQFLQELALPQGVVPALPPQGFTPPAFDLLRAAVPPDWRPQYPMYEETSKDLL